MIDGAKLDTARDSVNVKCKPKREKERITTSPNKSTRTPQKRERKHQRATINIGPRNGSSGTAAGNRQPTSSGLGLCMLRGTWSGTKEGAGREISDTGQTRVDGQRNSLVDVRLRGEIIRIASSVDVLRPLVHPYVVDRHDRREGQVFEIDRSEVGRNSQVDDHILGIRETPNR